jgi:hypothetical protein
MFELQREKRNLMSAEMQTTSPVVIMSKVPQVGDHVWFISTDELTEGMEMDGDIVEVTLDRIKVNIPTGQWPGEPEMDHWTLPLNDPEVPLYFSYVELLEAENEKLHTIYRAYYRKYGPPPIS